MTLSQAVEKLRTKGVIDALPVVPQDVYLSILSTTARASIHTVSTAYAYGAKIVPATANGRLYRCVIGGTGGATAPAWPAPYQARLGMRLTDGDVTWEDAGPAHDDLYDINAACRECWLWRVGQLTPKTDVSSDGNSIKRSQQFEHAVSEARRYGWRGAL